MEGRKGRSPLLSPGVFLGQSYQEGRYSIKEPDSLKSMLTRSAELARRALGDDAKRSKAADETFSTGTYFKLDKCAILFFRCHEALSKSSQSSHRIFDTNGRVAAVMPETHPAFL